MRKLPDFELRRQDAEDLVDMLEDDSDTGQLGMDWRYELADKLRAQWGMSKRQEAAQ